MKAYRKWLPATSRVVVVVDRDDEDCLKLKQKLEEIAANAGLKTKTSNKTRYSLVNRIVVEELEAWFFGDWKAVCTAYPRAPVFSRPDILRMAFA